MHAHHFGGRHARAASDKESIAQEQVELLTTAWAEGRGPGPAPLPIPPRVALEIRDLLGLPKRLRGHGASLSLAQLGWEEGAEEALWTTIRLLPAFKPRALHVPSPQNTEPPSTELKQRFSRALREQFVGGQVSAHADAWRRAFPGSPWAEKVAGVGWAFNRALGQFEDPIFQDPVDLDNHASCYE